MQTVARKVSALAARMNCRTTTDVVPPGPSLSGRMDTSGSTAGASSSSRVRGVASSMPVTTCEGEDSDEGEEEEEEDEEEEDEEEEEEEAEEDDLRRRTILSQLSDAPPVTQPTQQVCDAS